MKYKDISEIAKSKNLAIKDLCIYVSMTRPGLVQAIDNETIELQKLKKLCDFLRISPAQFFESGKFGIMINSGGHTQFGNNNKIIENYQKEIDYLKQQIADKNEIINLLKSKK